MGGSVGNTPNTGATSLPAYQAPIPWDEFEAPTTTPVCRAASGSIQQGTSFSGAGEQSPLDMKDTALFQQGDNFNPCEGENTSPTPQAASMFQRMRNFDTTTEPATDTDGDIWGAPGAQVITIKGGASGNQQKHSSAAHKSRVQHTYGCNTECVLQNLSMTVGNPSSRCYANAPWRAFTWTSALLQETHTEPWAISIQLCKNHWS